MVPSARSQGAVTRAERYRSGRNGIASKAICRVTGTWVRIPPSPPSFAKRSLRSRLRMASHVTRALAKDALRSGKAAKQGDCQHQTADASRFPAVSSCQPAGTVVLFRGDFGFDRGVTFARLADVSIESARFVYILRSSTDPSRRYIGLTGDIRAAARAQCWPEFVHCSVETMGR